MRSVLLISRTFLSAAILLIAAGDDKQVPPVKWEEDLDTAKTVAARTGKPLFVVFRCER
jgi:hypothetical protein